MSFTENTVMTAEEIATALESLSSLPEDWDIDVDGSLAPRPEQWSIDKCKEIALWAISNKIDVTEVGPDVLGGTAIYLAKDDKIVWGCFLDSSKEENYISLYSIPVEHFFSKEEVVSWLNEG